MHTFELFLIVVILIESTILLLNQRACRTCNLTIVKSIHEYKDNLKKLHTIIDEKNARIAKQKIEIDRLNAAVVKYKKDIEKISSYFNKG